MNESVARVLVVTYVLRPQLVRRLICSPFKNRGKVADVFITNFFPKRWGGFWQRCNRRLMGLMIRWQAGSLGGLPLVVWSYWPAGYTVAKCVGLKGTWVFDADHDLLHDENQSAGKVAEIESVFSEVIQHVDVVTAAARSALNWFEAHGARRVFRLRNGTTPCRFAERRSVRQAAENSRIGYLGVLSKWVDYELLCELAASRPDWRFVIGGFAYREDLPPGLKHLANVEFVGEVRSENVPDLLAGFDVALGLYRSDPWRDVDSMKFFDYLAAGVPVVTTPYHEGLAADFEGLLELAATAPEFASRIEAVLAWGEEARRSWDARRRQFAERQTWKQRADEALRFLQTTSATG